MKKNFFRRKLVIDVLDLATHYNGDMSKCIDMLKELANNSLKYNVHSKLFGDKLFGKNKAYFKYDKSFDYNHDKQYGLKIGTSFFVSYDYLKDKKEKITFTFYNVHFDDNIIEIISDITKYNI